MSGRQAQQTTQGQVGTAHTETTTSEKSGGGGGGLGGLVWDPFQLSCFGEASCMQYAALATRSCKSNAVVELTLLCMPLHIICGQCCIAYISLRAA
jgi:hypothetical protein